MYSAVGVACFRRNLRAWALSQRTVFLKEIVLTVPVCMASPSSPTVYSHPSSTLPASPSLMPPAHSSKVSSSNEVYGAVSWLVTPAVAWLYLSHLHHTLLPAQPISSWASFLVSCYICASKQARDRTWVLTIGLQLSWWDAASAHSLHGFGFWQQPIYAAYA